LNKLPRDAWTPQFCLSKNKQTTTTTTFDDADTALDGQSERKKPLNCKVIFGHIREHCEKNVNYGKTVIKKGLKYE